jgi:hypothetical protein
MLSEPPDADPHVRWCGGRRGEPGAYPIGCSSRVDRVAVTAGDPRIVGSVPPTAADRHTAGSLRPSARLTNVAPLVTPISSRWFSRFRRRARRRPSP